MIIVIFRTLIEKSLENPPFQPIPLFSKQEPTTPALPHDAPETKTPDEDGEGKGLGEEDPRRKM